VVDPGVWGIAADFGGEVLLGLVDKRAVALSLAEVEPAGGESKCSLSRRSASGSGWPLRW